jgi:hypothetical protein
LTISFLLYEVLHVGPSPDTANLSFRYYGTLVADIVLVPVVLGFLEGSICSYDVFGMWGCHFMHYQLLHL